MCVWGGGRGGNEKISVQCSIFFEKTYQLCLKFARKNLRYSLSLFSNFHALFNW